MIQSVKSEESDFKEKIKPLDELFTLFYLFSPIVSGIVASLGLDLRLLWVPMVAFLLWTLYIYGYRAKYQLQDKVELSLIERARGIVYFFDLVVAISFNSIFFFTSFSFEYKIAIGIFMLFLMFLLEWVIPRAFFQRQTSPFNKAQRELFRKILYLAGNVAFYYSSIVMAFNSMILSPGSQNNFYTGIGILLGDLIVVPPLAFILRRQERESRRLAKNLSVSMKATKWLNKYLKKECR